MREQHARISQLNQENGNLGAQLKTTVKAAGEEEEEEASLFITEDSPREKEIGEDESETG